jgi:hypothetical protein
MKAYGEIDILIHIFLNSAPVGGEWLASRPGRFTPGERADGTHLIGVWVDPRAGIDYIEKRKFLNLPGLELNPSVVQSRYTDCTIPAPHRLRSEGNNNIKFK